jgi:hypothetical protein
MAVRACAVDIPANPRLVELAIYHREWIPLRCLASPDYSPGRNLYQNIQLRLDKSASCDRAAVKFTAVVVGGSD